ncbi:MAG: DUF3782 domain-containing protein [Snowella sp.]|nr:DUF3782 domain-containing protein [Snowella sp.]
MTTTLEEVWDLFKQVAQSQQKTDRLLQETDLQLQETDRLMREQSQETDRRFQETDRRFQETDRRFQASVTENEKILQRLSKQIGDLGGTWGLFVENLVAPACETLFLERGIPVHQVSQRIKKRKGGETLEIDILVLNQEHTLVVEVKSRLSVADVQEFIADLQRFRHFFPEYSQNQLYGAVAGIIIDEGADRYAYRQGLFVLAQSGEAITALNNDEFQPKAW